MEDLGALADVFDVTADSEAAKGEPWVALGRIEELNVPEDGAENWRVLIDRSSVYVKLYDSVAHWGDNRSL